MPIDQNFKIAMSQGDRDAFKVIFKAFYSKVHHFALLLLKNDDDAKDVSQMVFAKLWIKRELIVGINSLDSYLFTMTKHTVLNYIAAKKIKPQASCLDVEPTVGATPHDELVAKDLQLLIDMVVDNMPQQRQAVYRMSREQHLKNEDIAERLGIQKKTVENHLNLALKEIRNVL